MFYIISGIVLEIEVYIILIRAFTSFYIFILIFNNTLSFSLNSHYVYKQMSDFPTLLLFAALQLCTKKKRFVLFNSSVMSEIVLVYLFRELKKS